MVRPATVDDIPGVIGLIKQFYSEPDHITPVVNELRAADVLIHALKSKQDGHDIHFNVIEAVGRPVGFILAERQQDLWSDALGINELFIYGLPEVRGTPAMGKLLLAFRDWCEQVPCAIRVQSVLPDSPAAKIYEKFGWEPRGYIYGKETFEVGT